MKSSIKARECGVCCRFLTAPSCIKRRARGAKPGVPHKRRQRVHNTTTSTSSTTDAVSECGQSCVTMSGPFSSSSRSPHVLPAASSPRLSAQLVVDDFLIEPLMLSSASRASLSSTSSTDSFEMTSSSDVKSLKLPPPLPISHLFADNVTSEYWLF